MSVNIKMITEKHDQLYMFVPECDQNENVAQSERDEWRSKTEYILSCMGCAIGLGNVLRFPYLCYRNGGGAFLIPYVIMLCVCGIPLNFMETCWGQFANTGCLTMFKLSPLFKGAGYAIIVVNFLTNVYYNIILSYPILFITKIIRNELPWASCNNEWNTNKCLELDGTNTSRSLYINNSFLDISDKYRTPADEFFHNEILQISSGIDEPNGIVWPLLVCSILSWLVIFMCIRNGVKSIEKVIYFTALFPYIILGVLFVRGITLPGAIDGIKFYITPQWDNLFNFKVWVDASAQLFFSLGPGWGGILNMSSFNKFRNNTQMDSILVPVINVCTGIFAGFVVFSILGYMSERTGLKVSIVATSGPGLAFITYPEAITTLPFPQLWAVCFFLMLYLLGIDSCFAHIETIVCAILDEYPQFRSKKQLAGFLGCLVFCVASIPCVTRGGMYWVQLLDWYAASVGVIAICIVEIVIVGWIYGVNNFVRDVEFMIGKKINGAWKICWKYITPVILLFIFLTSILFNTEVTYNAQKYPRWAIVVGWMICSLSLVMIPIYCFYKICAVKGSLMERLKKSIEPVDWHPTQEIYRVEWEKCCRSANKLRI